MYFEDIKPKVLTGQKCRRAGWPSEDFAAHIKPEELTLAIKKEARERLSIVQETPYHWPQGLLVKYTAAGLELGYTMTGEERINQDWELVPEPAIAQ